MDGSPLANLVVRSGVYRGKQNDRPLTVGLVATMKAPLLVLATALIALRPNFAARTFLHAAGLGLCGLKFFRVVRAQRETWALLTVWTMAPLLIQLAKLFSVVGVGRPALAGPRV